MWYISSGCDVVASGRLLSVHFNDSSMLCNTRCSSLTHGIQPLPLQVSKANFNDNPYLKDFGISIDHQMVKVTGRVLPAPKLQYGGRVSGGRVIGGQW